ncbi:SDR family oxidoreductase [Rossellomorea sp. KS-H15a]|uniref:dTDP-4-dehydrorhamnose reductase family protein n=1 Tax=Rossellomorea sp. KS-H15a TaxID=2963940 RepID=UPI0020C66BB6|nr:SDR family oxidoreductase [Rossellomorea sp. KS-H15a]UTE75474.1 SDR family oxidoreductase [Rossellomorea sp. KS-H15a]
MKILVLGGQGMAGHVIVKYLQLIGHEIIYTVRRDDEKGIFLDVRDLASVRKLILDLKPDIVINAVGLLNEHAEKNMIDTIKINSLLPHEIAGVLNGYGGKLIHISTDCVFSGEKGSYTEQSVKDGHTIYAKSKALGEVDDPAHLTVRTSIIGPETKENGIGLMHWFFKQSGIVNGYKNVFWNGVTTLELAKAIHQFMVDDVTGLYHLSSIKKISKYELLLLFKDVFDVENIEVHPVYEPVHDRSLVHIRKDYLYPVKGYREMLEELKEWMHKT